MATWKISNQEKKSVIETEIWRNSKTDQTVTIETGWRWGEWFVESDTEPKIDLLNESGCDPYAFEGYDVIDQNLDDGCWVEISFSKNIDEALQQKIDSGWEDDGYFGLEQLGFEHYDTDTEIQGPLLIEKVED